MSALVWTAFFVGAAVGYIFGLGYLAVHAPSAGRLIGACVVIGLAFAFGALAVIAFEAVTQ